MDLNQDLKDRWCPDGHQLTLANALLRAGWDREREVAGLRERGVYTAHMLVNKHYGFWTEDVQVVYLDGVFTMKEAATRYAEDRARQHHEETGEPVVGGWTWHSSVDHWAVWEDILARFPKPDEECAGECITRPHKWSPSGARCTRTGCNVAGTGDPCNDGNCEGED
jgi:hypothetical protein